MPQPDYWPFIEAAYGLCAALMLWFGAGSALRLRRARRALDRFEAS